MKFTFSRIKQEIIMPSNKYIRSLLHIIYSIKNFNFLKNSNNKALLIWDVRCNPITFDFIFAIFYTYSILVRKKGIKSFDLIIYFPEKFILKPFTFRNYDKFVDSEEINSRIQKMIISLGKSFNCINNLFLINNKNELLEKVCKYSIIYPRNYHPKYFLIAPLEFLKGYKFLNEIEIFNAPFLIPKRSSFFKKQKSINNILGENYITLTLRDYGYSPLRNTNQIDIEKAINVANHLKCRLVLVPDNIKNLKNYTFNNDIIILREAREDMYTRIKLYSKSKLNLFTTSGAIFVSLFLKNTKTIILNFCPGGYDADKQYYKKVYNIKVGDQPYMQLGGYLLWQDQYPEYTSEDILNYYRKLCKKNNQTNFLLS